MRARAASARAARAKKIHQPSNDIFKKYVMADAVSSEEMKNKYLKFEKPAFTTGVTF
jgi:hypothetical protein